MVARKKKTTRQKKTTQKNNIIAPILFLGLLTVAAAGWYVSFSNKPETTNKAYAQNTKQTKQSIFLNNQLPPIIPEQKVSLQTSQTPTPMSRQIKPEPITAQTMPVPQKKDLTFKELSSLLNKNNSHDSLETQDAAKIIFAQKRTVIYESANIRSKKIATVERGQEMRSYAKQGSWHKVTVPRAGIIGWAQESSFKP